MMRKLNKILALGILGLTPSLGTGEGDLPLSESSSLSRRTLASDGSITTLALERPDLSAEALIRHYQLAPEGDLSSPIVRALNSIANPRERGELAKFVSDKMQGMAGCLRGEFIQLFQGCTFSQRDDLYALLPALGAGLPVTEWYFIFKGLSRINEASERLAIAHFIKDKMQGMNGEARGTFIQLFKGCTPLQRDDLYVLLPALGAGLSATEWGWIFEGLNRINCPPKSRTLSSDF